MPMTTQLVDATFDPAVVDGRNAEHEGVVAAAEAEQASASGKPWQGSGRWQIERGAVYC
jgi:hypothetical protein